MPPRGASVTLGLTCRHLRALGFSAMDTFISEYFFQVIGISLIGRFYLSWNISKEWTRVPQERKSSMELGLVIGIGRAVLWRGAYMK